MGNLTLMIVDSNDDFRTALKTALQDIYRVYPISDGKEALNTAKQIRPDIIIMDLMLTGLDGITLLQELQEAGIRPAIMVVTRLNNAYIADWVDQLGISYVMLKPCDPTVVAKRANDLVERVLRKMRPMIDVAVFSAEQLNRLSVSLKHRGYLYLKESVVLVYENPNISITKELYPQIAAKFHVNAMAVERGIRSAINAAWLQGNPQIWAEFFPTGPDGSVARPSNGVFISRIADELRTCTHYRG